MFQKTRLTSIMIPHQGLQPKRKAHLLKLLAKSYDKYYTAPAVAAELFEFAEKWVTANLPLEQCARLQWVEPSAGGGAFLSPGVVGFDIYPDEDGPAGVQQLDFLDEAARTTALAPYSDRVLAFIGNPPFSANGAQAAAFVDAALHHGPVCAFVLPSSASRYTFTRRLPAAYRLAAEIPVDANSFTLMGDPYACPSVFQLWTTLPVPDLRPAKPLTSHPDLQLHAFQVEGHGDAARFVLPKSFPSVDPSDLLIYKNGYAYHSTENIRGLSALPPPSTLSPAHWLLVKGTSAAIERVDELTSLANRVALVPPASRVPGFSNGDLVAAYSACWPSR